MHTRIVKMDEFSSVPPQSMFTIQSNTHPTQTLYLNMKKLQKSKHTSQTTAPVSLYSTIKI